MKICIGIDQSYTDTGIAISIDGIPHVWKNESFKGCKNKTEKRNRLRKRLSMLFERCSEKTGDILVLVERIRTYTGGDFLRPNYLKSTGALVAAIVDVAYDWDLKVYSVDTHSWMSKVVGKPNKKKGEDKPSIKFVKRKYDIDVKYKTAKGLIKYNDNISDAICISLYGFCKGIDKLLKEEE